MDTAAYLLSLVDRTRREALNRAKREPFVIYMMSVLGDVSLARAGFERDLRDRIATAWRAEEYHEASKLIPDDLLDAFMLCGTREDVAERADAFHAATGLDLPLLQPVVQEESQTLEIIEAAVLYAQLPDRVPAAEFGRSGGRLVGPVRPRGRPAPGPARAAAPPWGRRVRDPPAVRLHGVRDPDRLRRRAGLRRLADSSGCPSWPPWPPACSSTPAPT